MIPHKVEKRIKREFASLSPGMKKVGRYLLKHPEDVALLTMREQSRRASVPAASMTRFAQRLGYSGYDEMRALFAASVRVQVSDFGRRAGKIAARREQLGETSFATDVAYALADKVATLSEENRPARIVDAASVLSSAEQIFCVGNRSCYAPAYHFAYLTQLNGINTRLLDAPGGIALDPLAAAGPADAMLAVSIAPYTSSTIETAASANALGVTVIALTDSAVSPLARLASHVISIPTDLAEAAFITAPIFAATEMLAALVVANGRPTARKILERNEAELARRRIYWTEKSEGPGV